MASSGRSFGAELGPLPQGHALGEPLQLCAYLELTLTESRPLSGLQGTVGIGSPVQPNFWTEMRVSRQP